MDNLIDAVDDRSIEMRRRRQGRWRRPYRRSSRPRRLLLLRSLWLRRLLPLRLLPRRPGVAAAPEEGGGRRRRRRRAVAGRAPRPRLLRRPRRLRSGSGSGARAAPLRGSGARRARAAGRRGRAGRGEGAVDAAAAAARRKPPRKRPHRPPGAAKKKKRRSAVKSRTKKKGGLRVEVPAVLGRSCRAAPVVVNETPPRSHARKQREVRPLTARRPGRRVVRRRLGGLGAEEGASSRPWAEPERASRGPGSVFA